MPLTVRKFNAQVKDPQSGQMVPAGLLSSDSLQAIEAAETAAITEIQQKGAQTKADIPDDYTELSDSVDELKTQINFYGLNLFNDCPKTTTTVSGVTWAWNKNVCTITGKATANTTHNIFWEGYTVFPQNIKPGEKYSIKYSNNSVADLQIRFFKNNAQLGDTLSPNDLETIKIPNEAEGMQIRLFVSSGTTATGTFEFDALYSNVRLNDIIKSTELLYSALWEYGAIALSNGANTDPSVANSRLRTKLFLPVDIKYIESTENWEFSVYVYNMQGIYQGNLQNIDNVVTGSSYWHQYTDLPDGYLYRLVFRSKTNPNTAINISDSTNCLIIKNGVEDNKANIDFLNESNLVNLITRYGDIKNTVTDRNVSFTWNDGVCSVVGTATGANAINRVIPRYKMGTLKPGDKLLVKVDSSDNNIKFRIHEYIDNSGNLTENDVYFVCDGDYVVPDGIAEWTFAIIVPMGETVNGTIKVSVFAGIPENIFSPRYNFHAHESWWVLASIGRNTGDAASADVANTRLCTNRFISDKVTEIHIKGDFEAALYVFDQYGNYLGITMPDGTISKVGNFKWFKDIYIDKSLKYQYKLNMRHKSNTTATLQLSDSNNCVFVEESNTPITVHKKPMITFIDDDTSRKTLVTLYHDLFDKSNYSNVPTGYNLAGCYAVEGVKLADNPTIYGLTLEASDSAYPDPDSFVVESSYTLPYNSEEQGTVLKNQLLEYELDGFEMIYHCMFQNGVGTTAHNTIYLQDLIYTQHNTVRSSDVIEMVRKNFIEGVRIYNEAGFVQKAKHIATPYGCNDKDIKMIAKTMGFESLIGQSNHLNRQFMKYNDGVPRYSVPRLVYRPNEEGTTEAMITRIDEAIADNGWLMFTTHVNEWGDNTASASANFIRLVQYCIDHGCEIVSYSYGYEMYKDIMFDNSAFNEIT